MTVRDTPWAAGTPCWVDLMTSDIAEAQNFYRQLFGWQLNVGGPESGGYVMAELGGRPVAGMMGMQPGQDHPPVWTTYLSTDDAAATAEKIGAAGGSILMPVMDVLDVGVMAMAQDPTGAVFGIWQPRKHLGFGVANEPNTLTWNELMTRDYAAAKAFYAEVFGYTYTEMGNEQFDYATFEVDGTTAGGLGALPAEVPAQVPPHWRAYFAVEDADAAVQMAEKLGGSVIRPAQDMPYGRHADLADPQGAMFAIIKPGAPA